MDECKLRQLLIKHLGAAFTECRGQVLYSGIDTLRPWRFYFIGFNPAADGTNRLLSDSPLGMTTWSAYSDQCWYCGRLASCPRAGKRPHQRQVRQIMQELGCEPNQTPATNLMFVESRTVDELNVDRWGDPCWSVHQQLLRVVRPEYIVCLGNGEGRSAFGQLRDRATATRYAQTRDQFKQFKGTFELGQGPTLRTRVIGVRHPSRPIQIEGLREFAGL